MNPDNGRLMAVKKLAWRCQL